MSEPLAKVILSMGRQHLVVGGIVLATEGDVCRDEAMREIDPSQRAWTPERLERAAVQINGDPQ